MNIAMLQQLSTKMTPTSSNNVQLSNDKFGTVFQQVMQASQQPAPEVDNNSNDLNAITKLLEAGSMEEVVEMLGLTLDESGSFIETEDHSIAVEDMMNFQNIAMLLNIEPEQLQNLIGQLLGNEVEVSDVWSLLEQTPNLLAQITTALKGEHDVSPKEAENILIALKLAQFAAQKTDTVYTQEVQLKNAQQALGQFVTQFKETELQQDVQVQQLASQKVEQLHNNVVQQNTEAKATAQTTVVQQTIELSQNGTKKETETTLISTHSQLTSSVKTVTITLPTERSAQSEALVKEIQDLINRSQASNNQGTMRLMLKLYPENLGSIRIEIMQKDGMLSARLLATTAAGKELLDSNLQHLKTALVSQNIQMERIDVAQSLQDAERNMRDQNLFSNFFKQQQQEEDNKQQSDEEEQKSFSEFLEEEV